MVRVLILLFSIILFSCSSSSSAIKRTDTEAPRNPLDQINYVPIIPKAAAGDSLFQAIKDSKTEIHLKIAGKVKTEYEIIKLWRVQIAALTDRRQAEEILEKAKDRLNTKAIIKEVNAFQKVLVGEFQIRAKADQFMYDVRNQGYPSAWVVSDEITVVKGSYKSNDKEAFIDFSLFRIQVGSYSSEIAANKVKKSLELLSKEKVIVYKKGNLYKVLVGESQNKNSLSELNKLILENGFKTWISNAYK